MAGEKKRGARLLPPGQDSPLPGLGLGLPPAEGKGLLGGTQPRLPRRQPKAWPPRQRAAPHPRPWGARWGRFWRLPTSGPASAAPLGRKTRAGKRREERGGKGRVRSRRAVKGAGGGRRRRAGAVEGPGGSGGAERSGGGEGARAAGGRGH